MDPNILLNNDSLKDISKDKLQFLLDFASKNKGKNPKDMLPLFLAASSTAKKKGVSFNSSETDLILEIMKQNMSLEEQKKLETILSMAKK